MKTSEVLRKAADEIRRRGWHQGDNEDVLTGAVCAYGALNSAVTGEPWRTGPNSIRVRGHLVRQVGAIATYNDHPDRTVEEVLDAFERAAQAAELEEAGASE